MNYLLRFLFNAVAVIATAYIVPGIHVASFWAALIAALVIGIINTVIRPVLLILTLPINIVTLGVFTFVINGLMFWLASSIVKGFDVANFTAAFLGAIVFWLVSWFTNTIVTPST